jgi:hypothetical protein
MVTASGLVWLATRTLSRCRLAQAAVASGAPVAPVGSYPRRDCVPSTPSVAVVICAYTEDRWADLTAAVKSVRGQSQPAAEIVVVIDYCPPLLARAACEFPNVTVIPNQNKKGLSGARNTGVTATTADIVAFLDDDAVAAEDWIATLVAPYAEPDVLGVGGLVLANWRAGRPSWFPAEFDWVVGCSYRGMPTERSPIRNFIGANMSFRRRLLVESGGFDTELGRIGVRPLGCEETELCIRVQQQNPQGVHLYEPTAEVRHSVPRARATWSYYRSRCFAEGTSKAVVSRLTSSEHALATERIYLKSTIPRGFGRYVGHALRGRPSELIAAMALMIGVVITGLGYTIGHAWSSRTAGPVLPDAPRWLGRIAGVMALPVAIALWLVSLPRIRLDLIGDYGLVPLLPLTFWAAMAVLLLSYAVKVRRGAAHAWLLSAHLITLIAFFHATPSAIYGTLRYSWAWKHVGVIDFFLRHSGIDGSIRELGVYQRWPGFFTLHATLVKEAGLQTALDYAPWAPLWFNILLLGPLYLIFRTFTTDRRLVWTALVIFVLADWVGQDYFAPQPTVYFLFLTIVALCVRFRASVGRGDPAEPRGGPRLGAALVLMVAAIAPTHQLTPIMVIVALGVLALCRYRVKTLLLAAIALALAWDLLFAWPWIKENLTGIMSAFGAPGSNASSGFISISDAIPSQVMVAMIDRALSAGVGVLAIFGFARRVGRHREPVLVLLALAPMSLIITNDYGGEMIFRIYLFALPFLAFYCAAAFFPNYIAGRSRWTRLTLPVVLLAFVPGFLFGYLGKEQANYFSHDEVAASRFVYGVAPRGSLIIGETSDFPWAFMNYEFYDYMRFGLFEPQDREAILADPVGMFGDMMSGRHHAYLIITRSQIADVEMIGAMPQGSMARLEQTLMSSAEFTVIFRTPDAIVFTLAQPDLEHSS